MPSLCGIPAARRWDRALGVNKVKIADFAAITHRVIARDSFDAYEPTAYYPERKHIAVLTGVPDSADVESVVLAWAAKSATEGEEVLVAFKLTPSAFKVMRRSRSCITSRVYSVTPNDKRQRSRGSASESNDG